MRVGTSMIVLGVFGYLLGFFSTLVKKEFVRVLGEVKSGGSVEYTKTTPLRKSRSRAPLRITSGLLTLTPQIIIFWFESLAAIPADKF